MKDKADMKRSKCYLRLLPLFENSHILRKVGEQSGPSHWNSLLKSQATVIVV